MHYLETSFSFDGFTHVTPRVEPVNGKNYVKSTLETEKIDVREYISENFPELCEVVEERFLRMHENLRDQQEKLRELIRRVLHKTSQKTFQDYSISHENQDLHERVIGLGILRLSKLAPEFLRDEGLERLIYREGPEIIRLASDTLTERHLNLCPGRAVEACEEALRKIVYENHFYEEEPPQRLGPMHTYIADYAERKILEF